MRDVGAFVRNDIHAGKVRPASAANARLAALTPVPERCIPTSTSRSSTSRTVLPRFEHPRRMPPRSTGWEETAFLAFMGGS